MMDAYTYRTLFDSLPDGILLLGANTDITDINQRAARILGLETAELIGKSLEDVLQQVGQEFFRAPNAQGSGITGTGLGLSIVQQYLEHFDGELSIHSQEGQGTTVTVKLRKSLTKAGLHSSSH